MRKVRTKNILERIDDSINDKIDDIKEKRKEKKLNKKKDDKKLNKKNKETNKKKIENEEIEDAILDDDMEDNLLDESSDELDEEVIEVKRKKKKKKISLHFPFMKKKEKAVKHSKNKTTKKDNGKKRRPLWKKILTFILILGIIGVLSVTAFLGYIVITAPEFSESALIVKDQTLVYDVNGNIIAKLGTQKRESISYDQMPQVLIDAIIATEDSRFFQHNGVDLFRFIKATALQLIGKDDAGGASTLTMQTVKNNITKKDNVENSSTIKGKIKKVIRKFQDVYLAVFKVEKKYSKEEILEMYVNDNGLGSSYYGVEEASKYYFGKSAAELTLPEASLIAGLFQAPGRHNPYYDIESATKRRTTVLKLMEKHGYITKEERQMAERVSIESLLVGTSASDNKYQGFIDTVVAEIDTLTGENPYTVPMKIYTTMDPSIQDGINSVFSSTDSYIWKDDKIQGGVAIVEAETGAISAVGARRSNDGINQWNYATQSKRQPGSTAKPIFAYGPAIENLNYSTFTQIMDERWSYTNGPNVNNWDGGYFGLISARYALQVSRNVPALKTIQAVGLKNSQKFAYSLGLDVALNSSSENYRIIDENTGLDNTINEAYSIGGVAEGFTPLEMASAYACFANGGYYIAPHSVTKIIYRETGEEKEFKYPKERVMKDSTAYIMNNILESAVTSGFNGGARVSGSHVAAKTGTSNYDDATMQKYGLPGYAVNDLWTVAYTSKYAVAVWNGYDNVDSTYYNHGYWKEHLTTAVMKYVPKDTVGWKMPSSVVAVTVEKETVPAALPSQYTPDSMKETGYFVRGTQPTEVSERYQKLNDITNYKKTITGNSVTITWDYQTPKVYTREYLQSYFNKSTFGNSKQAMVDRRLGYNENELGGIKFTIYQKSADGSLKELKSTSDKTFTYEGYGNTTLVIKVEHGNKSYASQSSNGVEIPIAFESFNEKDVEVTYETPGSINAEIGNYVEKGFKTVKYKNKDITKNITINYAVDATTDTYATATDFEKVINSLEAGTYTITYKINYLGNTIIRTRTLILS